MLVLDKARALDRMVWLADRKGNTPPEFLRPSPLRWTVEAGGRRALAGEVVLRPSAPRTVPEPAVVSGHDASRRADRLSPILAQLKALTG
jgi:hypothetical protein